MRVLSELRRRNVLRMAVLYAIAAWLIMQVAEVIIGLANLPEWIGLSILGLLGIGFPITLVISWFYELTPQGISLDKDTEPGESTTSIGGKRFELIVISLLVAAVILFAYDKWWTGPPPEKSIAVLAFENMSGDPEQEYFSDGISEELLNLLAQIPELTVISLSSAFSFKGKDIAIPEVAEQLNVAYVLEGSVRKDGNRIRITAQLIEARSDKHLWSRSYNREFDDIFAVQDEISAAIVMALKNRLELEVEAAPRSIATANTEAHEAYLRGRHLVVQRTGPTVEGAVREFEKAISLDPDYALAHAELAQATLLMQTYTDVTAAEANATSAPYAERAMSLDPTLAEAHAAMGFLSWSQSNLEEALSHFRQAVQIKPSYSIVYVWMGILLRDDLGRYAEAFPMHEKAARLDPLSIVAIHAHADALIERGRLAEGGRVVQKLAALAPCRYAVERGWLTSRGGEWVNWLLAALDGIRIDPVDPRCRASLAMSLALIGLDEEALAIPEAPQPIVHSMLGRAADALAPVEARLAEDPNSAEPYAGVLLASVGDYSRARPFLEEWWQRSDRRVKTGDFLRTAKLAATRRAAGDDAGVSEVVAAIRDNVRRYREAGIIGAVSRFDSADIEEGVADYYAGDRERGLASIAGAVEDGVFILPNGGLLPSDVGPGFDAILATQEARRKREREKFLAIVCNDNPYADFWQPMPETCEDFEI